MKTTQRTTSLQTLSLEELLVVTGGSVSDPATSNDPGTGDRDIGSPGSNDDSSTTT